MMSVFPFRLHCSSYSISDPQPHSLYREIEFSWLNIKREAHMNMKCFPCLKFEFLLHFVFYYVSLTFLFIWILGDQPVKDTLHNQDDVLNVLIEG